MTAGGRRSSGIAGRYRHRRPDCPTLVSQHRPRNSENAMFAKILVAIASIALLPAAAQVPAPSAAAADIDLNALKCGDFIKSDPESAKRIMFWLAGYYTYEDDTAV